MIFFLLGGLQVSLVAQVNPAPSLSKSFSPETIGPGSSSTLTFTITNSGSIVKELAFTDNLPAGMTIASPSSVSNSCQGTLSGPEGGSLISFSNGQLGAGSSCSITIDITSGLAGIHTNTTSSLSSDAGTSGSASADLTVATDRPGFTKSFSPPIVDLGTKSTLSFLIDNSANTAGISRLAFTDNLPSGMLIASPANVSTTCPNISITANPNSNVLSVTDFSGLETVTAGATCSVHVDVIATAVGSIGNVSGDLTTAPYPAFTSRSSGKASATLSVNATADILLTKEFIDDPVAPGDTAILRFTMKNLHRRGDATNISFTDDLDAVLSGLEAVNFSSASSLCGTGSGTGLISFAGGTLGTSQGLDDGSNSCSFDVQVAVPSTAPDGSYTNTTSQVTATINGNQVTGNSAVDVLHVVSAPKLVQSFTDDPVTAGGSVNLEFTISNPSLSETMTEITFEEIFEEELPTAVSIPATGFCGNMSAAVFSPRTDYPGSDAIKAKLIISKVEIAPGDTCIFSIVLDVAEDAATGTYEHFTSPVTASVGALGILSGNPARDDLLIVSAPDLSKAFINDPVIPGDPVILEFKLAHHPDAPGNATNIAFMDDLTTMSPSIAGIAATTVIQNTCGGTMSVTTVLSYSGGSLSPGQSCTVQVQLDFPDSTKTNTYTNTTNNVSATVEEVSVSGKKASDQLQVVEMSLTKEFIDDPALPGSQVTLQFTINNEASTTATGIYFQDNLSAVIPGLVATAFTNNTCPNSSIVGTSTITFSGGSLTAGSSCSVDVTLDIPTNAASSEYTNVTNSFRASFDGGQTNTVLANARDDLSINNLYLELEKEFNDDPAPLPGETVNLVFTLNNLHNGETINDISFSDDLNAGLTGMVLTSVVNTSCVGATISGIGTGALNFTDGSLSAVSSCSFIATLTIPNNAGEGSDYSNTTSSVSGSIGSSTVVGDPATDFLSIGVTTELLADAGSMQTIECGNPGGVPVTLDASNSTPGVGTTQYAWFENVNNNLILLGNTEIINISVLPGMHKYRLVLRDEDSNESYATVVVLVTADLEAPVANCQDVTVELDVNGMGSTSASAVDNNSSDDCGIESIVLSQSEFDCGHLGNIPVTLTVTDKNGKVDECAATVTVQDAIAPVAICQDVTVQLDVNGNGSASATDINNGSSDACGILGLSLDNSSFNCSHVGSSNTVILTVTDNNSNIDTCAAIVTVQDNVAPVALCQDVTVQLDVNGNGSTSVIDINNGSSDACSISGLSLNNSSFNCSNVGSSNTVILTVTDINSNIDTCTAIVTVQDSIAPVAICQDVTVQLDAAGNGSITTVDIDNGSNDACGVSSTSIDITSFTCEDVGVNTVTLTVVDVNGNGNTCTSSVSVEDVDLPVITLESSESMWPPNHKYKSFELEDMVAAINDVCDGSIDISSAQIISASSDEPENGSSDGNTLNDIVISNDCQSIDLRSERNANGNGRVYTVNIEVADSHGNTANASYLITVPKSKNGSSAIDDGVFYTEFCGGGSFSPRKEPINVQPDLLISPNPAVDEIYLNLSNFEDHKIQMQIFNVNGQRMYSKSLARMTSFSERIDISKLQNGTYHLVVKQGEFRKSATFIKTD